MVGSVAGVVAGTLSKITVAVTIESECKEARRLVAREIYDMISWDMQCTFGRGILQKKLKRGITCEP